MVIQVETSNKLSKEQQSKIPSELQFHGGILSAFIPLFIFLAFCVLYFVILKAFDMSALAMGAFVGLLIGSVLAKRSEDYWNAVFSGMGAQSAVSIVAILFVVGMLSALIKVSGISDGFVWLAQTIGVTGNLFTLFVFIAVCIIAMATGSSIGTMFTVFPIFFPAGILLGSEPSVLAAAIISGGIFGDNLAPISDTTVISAASQQFRKKDGVADIGGVVSSRAPYALSAALLSAILFMFFGGTGQPMTEQALLSDNSNARSLWMLLPIFLLLIVAIKTRDIFKAVIVGLVAGSITALLFGLITFQDIIGITDGNPSGFLVSGVSNMLSTVALVMSVFGIMGVLRGSGILDKLVSWITHSKLAQTPTGAEFAIGLGSSIFTIMFGGVNSASMITFGPIADEVGSKVGLHPYRRANVMDCFAMGLSAIIPFLSAFVFIGVLLAQIKGNEPLSPFAIFPYLFYPLMLTLVMIFSIITGWGRRFEGKDGIAIK